MIWAGYAALLGYFGGRAFEQHAWKGLLLALGIAFAVTLGTEAIRWLLRRRHRRRQTNAEPGDGAHREATATRPTDAQPG